MGSQRNGGFTIIESMLVLAISGVLIVALLAGVGTSINVQRYRDSVVSFKSLIQGQYSELLNVRNDRTANWQCDATASPEQGGAQTPGQSDCVLLGRYISVDQSDITIASIVGYQTAAPSGNDINDIRNNYTLGISSATIERQTLEWGTRLADANRSVTIIMLRSPSSGTSYTFTSNSVKDIENVSSDDLKGPIVAGNTVPGQAERTLCVDSNGLILIGDVLSVSIAAYASGPSAVELRTNNIITSLGGTVLC